MCDGTREDWTRSPAGCFSQHLRSHDMEHDCSESCSAVEERIGIDSVDYDSTGTWPTVWVTVCLEWITDYYFLPTVAVLSEWFRSACNGRL